MIARGPSDLETEHLSVLASDSCSVVKVPHGSGRHVVDMSPSYFMTNERIRNAALMAK